MTAINGTFETSFTPVAEAFEKNFEEGDLGACCAVFVDGEIVVDLWGGTANSEKETLWEKDTIVNVWSTTKTMTAICILMLFDRGLIELDSPVCKYWKNFEQNGKENISTVIYDRSPTQERAPQTAVKKLPTSIIKCK